MERKEERRKEEKRKEEKRKEEKRKEEKKKEEPPDAMDNSSSKYTGEFKVCFRQASYLENLLARSDINLPNTICVKYRV